MGKTFEHLDSYRKSSARQKLEWLEEAKEFVLRVLPEEKLKRWLRYRERS